MSTQHTSGPWETNGCQVTAQGDMRTLVASCHSKNDPVKRFDAAADTIAEAEANARLIAAAPDMLEALEATLAGLKAWVEIADDDDKRDEDNEALAMAQVAIAKAKGNPDPSKPCPE